MQDEREMTTDAELLDAILNEAICAHDGMPITAKRVAQWTNLSIKTISDYRRGLINIPASFWSYIQERCDDARIFNLILGRRKTLLFFTDTIPDVSGDAAAFRAASQQMAEFCEQQKYLASILADGRIDETDADAMRSFNAAHARALMSMQQLHHAINQRYAKSAARRALA